MNHSNISRDFSNQTFYSTNDYEESTFMDDASTQSFPMPNSLSYRIRNRRIQRKIRYRSIINTYTLIHIRQLSRQNTNNQFASQIFNGSIF
ncbi:uncharacterized protein OCT59_014723 [Rhizophagus irregularis]|uniref:Uncharacterized protein n=1 Tax=Rhizophagus irregularis TaxID=588596 RepID=A0A915ZRE7_9GLOM|nr:hypothetical protein OCT59_014723 [Rhizophagus irregularis]CAB4391277.1 unnamed protein product [Rhizophagus irregularis]CAB5217346.1 unnamed protein product [Rhizophagus irregularis]CAB5387227.1 unnamed protein product [Rhizophagus irregularis]